MIPSHKNKYSHPKSKGGDQKLARAGLNGSWLCFLWILFTSLAVCQSSLSSPAQAMVESGIQELYSYQFDAAREDLNTAGSIDPRHPVVPFLKLVVDWLDVQTQVDFDSSYRYLQMMVDTTAGRYRELLADNPQNAELWLYLGSTYGMAARAALARKEWLDVLVSGYQGYRLVEKARQLEPDLLDIHMPLGSLAYYACKSSAPVRWLAGLLGVDTECEGALTELELAAAQSHYSWIEASNVLTYAYLYLEGQPEIALHWVSPLVERFPTHPFFSFLQAEALARMSEWEEFEKVEPRLEQLVTQVPGVFQPECRLKLTYCQALRAFEQGDLSGTIQLTSWMIDHYDMEFDWLLGNAHLLRGKAYDRTGNRQAAVADYNFTAHMDNPYPEVAEARQLIQTPYREETYNR